METMKETGTLTHFCVDEETVRFHSKDHQGLHKMVRFRETESAETIQRVRFLADTMQEVNIVYSRPDADQILWIFNNVTPVEPNVTIGELVVRRPRLTEQLPHRRRFAARINQPENGIRGAIDTWEDGSASIAVQQTDEWGQVESTKAYFMADFASQRTKLAQKAQDAANAIVQFEEIAQPNQLEGCPGSHLAEVQLVRHLLDLTPR